MPVNDIPAPFDKAHQRSFGAGEMILYEGDPSDSMYLIESGQVEVVLEDAGQGEELVLAFLGEGEIFGEMSLFSQDRQRCAMIRTISETQVRVCDKNAFVAEANADHGLWMRLVQQLAGRLRNTNRRYSDRAFHNVKTRVAHILAELASKLSADSGQESGAVVVNITRTDLARFASCSREVAGQAVLDLGEEGLLEAAGREIRLKNPEKLRNYGQ